MFIMAEKKHEHFEVRNRCTINPGEIGVMCTNLAIPNWGHCLVGM